MKKVSILFLILALFSGVAHANLIVNGSFELGPDLSGGLFVNLYAGSTAITGWTVGGNSIDYVGPINWNASNGLRMVDLDGSRSSSSYYNGSISQTFATTIGQKYIVNFDLSGNPEGLPLIKQVQVSAGDNAQVFLHDIGSTSGWPFTLNYSREEFAFTATGAFTTLSFTSLTYLDGITGWGPVIDNVVVDQSINPVPEPSTMLLLGSGIVGLAGFRKKFKK